MFKIKTMNNIAQQGLDVLLNAGCETGPDVEAPEGLLIRSAKLHDAVFDPELLCIGRAGIGYDNVPVERCTEEGIAVFNTPGANAESVKELVLSALTLASRDVIGAEDWVRSIADQGDKIPALVEKGKKDFVGPEISGKRLGVIGLGAIGSRVANAALRLDMDVAGYDPFLSVDSAWNLSGQVEHVRDLNVLYATCDYITMHIHLTPETENYLNAEAFAKMKPGVRILNFSRGELVDDDAMIEALESGQVARYITDFPHKKLVGRKNVVALPHLGACTPEAEEKCAVAAAREILDYLRNGNVRNSVNLPATELNRLGESRLCLIHKNKPGMLNAFLEIIAKDGVNVEHMLNKARGDLAYTIFDTTTRLEAGVAEEMRSIPGVTRVRLL